MKAKVFIGIILAATLLIVPAVYIVKAQEVKSTVLPQPSVSADADTIFTLVNKERTQRGLKPLVRDARLDTTAQERADDMLKRDYFSHYDPIDGRKMINDQDFKCQGGSENIVMPGSRGNANLDAVMNWMTSPPHRKAILRADYTLTGVAVSGDKVVQHFCVTK